MDQLLDIVSPQAPHDSGKMQGVVVGIVTNNKDPDGMGRVRVKFPWLSGSDESWWARIATTMAGSSRGTYFLPEVDDEVLVSFEHGDIKSPFIVGGLWNGKDAPPTTNSDGKNNIRMIKSRSGHIVRLDDTSGNEKIEIIDQTGSNSITIKSSDNSITITCNGTMKLEAKTGIEITSQAGIKIQANANIDMSASALVNIKGTMINLNS